jgi:NDP-sugar pyrophosphorylase family protein
MNILVLAAGAAPADARDGSYPLCLAEIEGTPMIERILHACHTLPEAHVIVALRDEDIRLFHLDNVVRLVDPGASVVRVREATGGAACTALLAVGEIDRDDELVILNGNELLDADFPQVVASFRARGLDAGVVTFPSIHPRYSYVRLDERERVIEASEKRPISRLATAGFYWFARGRDFVDAAKDMIRKNGSVNGSFYICPALNQLVLRQSVIGTFPVEARQYHPLKTERQLQQYEAAAAEAS